MTLTDKLINSLLESHKPFDDFIKGIIKPMNQLDDIEKDVFAVWFNNQKYRLILDVEAHHVLEKLEYIERQNRR